MPTKPLKIPAHIFKDTMLKLGVAEHDFDLAFHKDDVLTRIDYHEMDGPETRKKVTNFNKSYSGKAKDWTQVWTSMKTHYEKTQNMEMKKQKEKLTKLSVGRCLGGLLMRPKMSIWMR